MGSSTGDVRLTLSEAQSIWKALLDAQDRLGEIESIQQARRTIEDALSRADDGPGSFTEL